MENQTSPPSPENFASVLRGHNGLTPEEYDEFLNLWNKFNIKSLAHLSFLYNQADVLILADTLAFYLNKIHEVTGVFPTHLQTISGLAVKGACLQSRDPDRPWKRLFLQFVDERVYDLFSEALVG